MNTGEINRLKKLERRRLRMEKYLRNREANNKSSKSSFIDYSSVELTVVTWMWNRKNSGFLPDHVHALRDMVARRYDRPHRFVCITDDPSGLDCEAYPLWDDHSGLYNLHRPTNPSCFRRLKLFSKWASEVFGPRRVSLDLDCVVTGDLKPLWDRPEFFVGWKVPATEHISAWQGSMWLIQGDYFHKVWDEFNPEVSPRMAYAAGFGGTDQAWMSMFIGNRRAAGSWTNEDGVYNWVTDIRGAIHRTPRNSRIVFFPGKHGKPWDANLRRECEWMRENYPELNCAEFSRVRRYSNPLVRV